MSGRNAPCDCGSGRRRKHCCEKLEDSSDLGEDLYAQNGDFVEGLRGVNMRRFCPEPPGAQLFSRSIAPPGILVVEGFLPAKLCDDFCDFIIKQRTRTLGVLDSSAVSKTGQLAYKNHVGRITDTVDLGHRKKDMLREVVRGYRDYVTRYFAVALDTIEPPSVLKYSIGGRYDPHADSEHWDKKNLTWVRSVERDFSLLMYLNDGYEGGALQFTNFNWRIQPKRGMLIAFPSDHRYRHGAEPLISGVRIAVASWAKRKAVS